MKDKRVLFVGTSCRTRGGITSVIQSYMRMPLWNQYHIKWVGTHIDRSPFLKVGYAISGFLRFLFLVWAYDLIHFHISTSSSAMRKYLFCKVAKGLRKKVVVHLHIGNQFKDQLKNQRGRNAYGILFKDADAIIVLSEQTKKDIKELYHVEKNVHVVYNPCDEVRDVSYSPDNKEVLYAGILNQNKGYATLLKAFSLINGKYPEWIINFAGNGEIDKAKELAESLAVTNQVRFLGWVKGNEKDLLFRRASIYCLASYNEGFPMAVLDALGYGLPVIATHVGGLPDVLYDGENAFLFEPGDYEQLARKLDKLMSDKHIRETLSRKSLELANGDLSSSHINNIMTHLYSDILSK